MIVGLRLQGKQLERENFVKPGFVIQFVGRVLLGGFVFLGCGALMVCLLAPFLSTGENRILFVLHLFYIPPLFVLSLGVAAIVMSVVDRWTEKRG